MRTQPVHPSSAVFPAFRHISLFLALAAIILPKAAAFAPQDSSNYASKWSLLSDELWEYNAKVINNKVWYSHKQGGIRARNFSGEVVFTYEDASARFHDSGDNDYEVSADGRLYYFYDAQGYWSNRIAIVSPEGTRLGDFAGSGRGAGFINGGQTIMAISPITGRVYLADTTGAHPYDYYNPTDVAARKGRIKVFDRDGNFLHEFRTTGILATTLEGGNRQILVRGDATGKDEILVVDTQLDGSYGWVRSNLKVFGGDGAFRRLPTGGIFGSANSCFGSVYLWKERLVFSDGGGIHYIAPVDVTKGDQVTILQTPTEINKGGIGVGPSIGVHTTGAWIKVVYPGSADREAQGIHFYSYPNFSNFDASSRNAVPNPWVMGITQRPGSGIVDIDYRVDDTNDSTVTTALVGFANGLASLTNVLSLNTLLEDTGTRLGANQPTDQVRRVTWNASADWNVDFGTLRVMALARDSRTNWFDIHLVEIPADGTRPAVAISRNPLREEDFMAQFFWLVATKDTAVRLVDGVLFGTTGPDNGVILANGTASTVAGRAFLLKRDGLRVATTEEVTRAREGATPGFTVRLPPPLRMLRNTPSVFSAPDQINEFGIESSGYGTEGDRWYVVRAQTN